MVKKSFGEVCYARHWRTLAQREKVFFCRITLIIWNYLDMASTSKVSSSSFAPEESSESLRKKLKYNSLSKIPIEVIVEGDVSSYIYCRLEDLWSLVIHSQLSLFCGKDKKIKPEYNMIKK